MSKFQTRFLHPRYWLSWLGLGMMRISIYLPIWLQLRLGKLQGWLMRQFMPSRVHIARRNIELCFPELDEVAKEKLVHENFHSMGMMMIETALSWWGSDKQIAQRVRYEGVAHLEAAKAQGKGIILLTGHFTNMEIGARFAVLKTPFYVMYRQMKNKLFNQMMMNARGHHIEGAVMHDDIRGTVRALRKGKTVWYAPDQDFGRKNSVYAKFFGINAATVPAVGRIVAMTGAAVVPFTPRREADGRYTLTFHPAWEPVEGLSDVEEAQRMNDWVEQEVKKAPAQYYWVHRRFKTQPDGRAQLYK
jgi:KDO2-lipid IV(A) lauroyltransferase